MSFFLELKICYVSILQDEMALLHVALLAEKGKETPEEAAAAANAKYLSLDDRQ